MGQIDRRRALGDGDSGPVPPDGGSHRDNRQKLSPEGSDSQGKHLRDRIVYMRRFIGECVCVVIGIAASSEIFLPEHHNPDSFNYSFSEKVGRHPVATGVLLVAMGIVVVVTIRKMIRP